MVSARPSPSPRTIASSWLGAVRRRRARRRSGRLAAGAQGHRHARPLLGHVHRAARDSLRGASRSLPRARRVPRRRHPHAHRQPRVAIDVPAYLLYQLDDGARAAGGAHGGALAAGAAVARRAQLGPRAWLPMTLLFGRMLRRMGLGLGRPAISRRCGAASAARVGGGQRARRGDRARATRRRWRRSSSTTTATVELGTARRAERALLTLFPAGSRLEVDRRRSPPAGPRRSASHRRPRADPKGWRCSSSRPTSRRIRRARFFPA